MSNTVKKVMATYWCSEEGDTIKKCSGCGRYHSELVRVNVGNVAYCIECLCKMKMAMNQEKTIRLDQ